MDRNYLIDEIIQRCNFEKVHIAMTALDWRWATEDKFEVPSIKRLKEMARHLLLSSISSPFHTSSSGGFEAKYLPMVDDEPESFELRFILVELSN